MRQKCLCQQLRDLHHYHIVIWSTSTYLVERDITDIKIYWNEMKPITARVKKKKPTCNWNVERMTKKALFLKYIPQFNSSNYLKLIRGSFYLNQVSDLFCGDDWTKLNFSCIRFETNKRAKILSRELSQTLYYITSEIQNSRHRF